MKFQKITEKGDVAAIYDVFICGIFRNMIRELKKYIAFLLIMVIGITVSAQTNILDSIKNEINKHPERDTIKVGIIMDYVIAAENENTSQILPFLNELVSISKEKNYRRGIQFGYMTAQIYYSDRGDFTNAMLYADSAFLFFKGDTARKVLLNVGYLHNNLAGDYYKMGDYQMAIDNYIKAGQMLEKYRPEAMASVYSSMAEVYEKLFLPAKALEYDVKAIGVAEKSGDKSSIVKRYLNYAGRHVNLQKFEEADRLLNKIEPMVMEVQESFAFVYFYQNRGYVFKHRKQLKQAIDAFKKAYGYAEKSDDKYQQLSLLTPLSDCLMDVGNMDEAYVYIDTLLTQSKRYKMRFGQLNAYNSFAGWYSAKGNYKIAFEFLQKKSALADSINTEEIKEKIATAETRFKVLGKDKEIKLLQSEKELQQLSIRQKNTLNYILLGGAAGLLLILFLSYRNYRNKQKLQQQRINELETENQLAATEAVLKGEEQERSRLAKDLHDGLGGMLSGIKYSLHTMKGNLIMTPDNAQAFERSMDMLDSSIQEMRRVAHNMMPEALVKFGLDTALKDFCNDINQTGALQLQYQSLNLNDQNIQQTTAITVYRVVQELVNNIIKHAAAKHAIVQLSLTGSNLQITVEDDGKGFDTSVTELVSGIGWKNIRNRIDFLKGKIDLRSESDKGTSVNIEVNVA